MSRYDPAVDHNPMFDVPVQPSLRDAQPRRRTAPTAAHALCPECHTEKPIGLVWVGEHLCWKVHDKVTLSGARMQCRASGARVCETDIRPSREYPRPNCDHAY